jgi:hypothetical protein
MQEAATHHRHISSASIIHDISIGKGAELFRVLVTVVGIKGRCREEVK